MNKRDLIRRLAKTQNTPYTHSKIVIDSIIDIIYKSIQNGESIKITGIGTLKVVERDERVGIDPISLKRVTIPKTKSIKFIASSKLKGFITDK